MLAKIKIDEEFSALIPPLSEEERHLLEQSIIDEGGARDSLVVWAGTLLDGHNRFEICTRLDLPYNVHEVDLDSREEAADWIDANQLGRRNLTPDSFRLLLGRRYNRIKKNPGRPDKLPQNEGVKGETAERLAEEHGVSRATVERAGKFAEEVAASPELQQAIIDQVPVTKVKREMKRREAISQLEDISTQEAKELAGHYDVVVIDPPWAMQKIERDVRPNQSEFDYPTMDEDELASMDLPMADDCHVWVWTTHKFLPMAFRLLDTWGLKYVCTFVWHKPGGFQPIGLPQYNCEFAIYSRQGSPQFVDTKALPVCFEAPRGKHSEKPEAFYEVVRRVTAGRRLDMFNRRAIEGFDVWGNEA